MTSLDSGRAEGAAYAAPKITLVKSTDRTIKDRLVAQHERIIPFTENKKMFA